MKDSLRSRIKAYFQRHQNEWINGGTIEELAMKCEREDGKGHYKASNASRRLREHESGWLSPSKDGVRKPCEKFLTKKSMNGSVWYMYLPSEKIVSRYQEVDGVMRLIQEKILA